MQASKGLVPVCLGRGWGGGRRRGEGRRGEGLQQRGVGLHAQEGGGEELLAPRQVIAPLEREHEGDEPCGGFAIGANCGRPTSSISPGGGCCPGCRVASSCLVCD